MTDNPLPTDEFLVLALIAFGYSSGTLASLKNSPSLYTDAIAHARALQRIAELETGTSRQFDRIIELSESNKALGRQRDEAIAKVSQLEDMVTDGNRAFETVTKQRDEALARLAKHEPPVDPDLVLAREVVVSIVGEHHREAIMAGAWDTSEEVIIALAGIKAGRAGGGL